MEQQALSEPTPELKQFEEEFRTAVQDILQFYPDSDELFALRPETLMEDYSDLDETKRQIMEDIILQATGVNPGDPETIVRTYSFIGKDHAGQPIQADVQIFDIHTTNQDETTITIYEKNAISGLYDTPIEQAPSSGYLHVITYDTQEKEYCIGALDGKVSL